MIYELFSQFSVKVCFWSYFYNYKEEIPQTNSFIICFYSEHNTMYSKKLCKGSAKFSTRQ